MNAENMKPAPRVPLQLEIEFKKSYSRSYEKGSLKNISLSGAFLELALADMKATDKLSLVLTVGGRKRKLAAHVIWANSRGCGIKFAPTNNRDVQIVDDLMYFVENSRETRRSVLNDIFKRVA
jgi:hypothetical protein